jgi:DNA-directed RNA polymerase subunit M/transcription elongation factor TFIIS
MATSYVIACPDCGKQIKVTAQAVGKKIRCKQCQATFPVAESKLRPADGPKPAGKKPSAIDDEDEDGGKPYALAKDQDDLPRCPHCAKELESADARICLNCGYNMLTRQRFQTKAVHEATGEDKFKWLLPGILCVIGIIIVITVSIICVVKTTEWMKGGLFHDTEDGKDKFMIHPGCFKLFNGLLSAFICFHLGKFAYRRLVLNPEPPEQVIQKGDSDDDDEDDDEDEDDDD